MSPIEFDIDGEVAVTLGIAAAPHLLLLPVEGVLEFVYLYSSYEIY